MRNGTSTLFLSGVGPEVLRDIQDLGSQGGLAFLYPMKTSAFMPQNEQLWSSRLEFSIRGVHLDQSWIHRETLAPFVSRKDECYDVDA